MSRKPKSNALQELYEELIGDDPQKQANYEEALVNVKAAQLLYDMGAAAGLSQARVGQASRNGGKRNMSLGGCRLQRPHVADVESHCLNAWEADRASCGPQGDCLGRNLIQELTALP
jgi:hypothetical protein